MKKAPSDPNLLRAAACAGVVQEILIEAAKPGNDAPAMLVQAFDQLRAVRESIGLYQAARKDQS